jgi:peptidoglycan-associated lipoprotein
MKIACDMNHLKWLAILFTTALLAACATPRPATPTGAAVTPPGATGSRGSPGYDPYAHPGGSYGSAPTRGAAGPAGAGRVVYFDFDSAEIRVDNRAVIEANAQILAAGGTPSATLEGHTDERGSREYNIGLGERRAEAVRRALSAYGVGSRQLQTVSFGEERPAAAGQDESAYAKNRRVEIVY